MLLYLNSVVFHWHQNQVLYDFQSFWYLPYHYDLVSVLLHSPLWFFHCFVRGPDREPFSKIVGTTNIWAGHVSSSSLTNALYPNMLNDSGQIRIAISSDFWLKKYNTENLILLWNGYITENQLAVSKLSTNRYASELKQF